MRRTVKYFSEKFFGDVFLRGLGKFETDAGDLAELSHNIQLNSNLILKYKA